MAKVAVLGATSHVARDLIAGWAQEGTHDAVLFARRPDAVAHWAAEIPGANRFPIADYAVFGQDRYDAILNFVGIGDPAAKARMGADIIGVTTQFDELALAYLRRWPDCRYVFLSSGAAYGGRFETPADAATPSRIPINTFTPGDLYGAAKLMAELRHRALPDLPILDIRLFSYFSRTQDPAARFFMSDILRALHDRRRLWVTDRPMVRDYLHPRDFRALIACLLAAPAANDVVDAYSVAPIDKHTMLSTLRREFGLDYLLVDTPEVASPSSTMEHYYSRNRRAADYGYSPAVSSLRCLIEETGAAMGATRPMIPAETA